MDLMRDPFCKDDEWAFSTGSRIRFGWGISGDLPTEVRALGSRVLVVTGKSPERFETLIAEIRGSGAASEHVAIQGEPTIADIESAIKTARRINADVVVGIGGGSAMDAAKAIAALAPNPGEPRRYLEIIGVGETLPLPGLPCICVPTTAGSGAEVTRNAVLSAVEEGVKVSLRGPQLIPRIAFIDPELTVTCVAAQTAFSGLDALTQLIEAYVTPFANPITDALCANGIRHVVGALEHAYHHPGDRGARTSMALAALFSGIALTNARLGAVHGLAAVIGGRFPAPHGAVCARLLPSVFAANLRVLELRADSADAIKRFDSVARILTGDPEAMAPEAVDWLRRITDSLNVPGLCNYGVDKKKFSEIIRRSRHASSMRGNPCTLSDDDLLTVLRQAL